MSRRHWNLHDDEEVNTAAWAATRGAVVGAAKWGLVSAIAAGVAFQFSPIYRGLTFQFKVFIQMSGMAIGSMIEADRRLRAHELAVRNYKRRRRDVEIWRQYEQEFGGKESQDVDNSE